MKIELNGKEYNIKFGYKPTLKERIISKVVKLGDVTGENDEVDMEKVEDLLLFLPELLLVGLQVNHNDFRYDYDTKEGKDKQLEKAFDIVEEYMSSEDANVMQLFNQLQEALTQDGFLASLFRQETSKQKKQKAES